MDSNLIVFMSEKWVINDTCGFSRQVDKLIVQSWESNAPLELQIWNKVKSSRASFGKKTFLLRELSPSWINSSKNSWGEMSTKRG